MNSSADIEKLLQTIETLSGCENCLDGFAKCITDFCNPSLRDQLAMSVAPAVFSSAIKDPIFKDESWETTVLAVAKVCYKFADACQAEREKKQNV